VTCPVRGRDRRCLILSVRHCAGEDSGEGHVSRVDLRSGVEESGRRGCFMRTATFLRSRKVVEAVTVRPTQCAQKESRRCELEGRLGIFHPLLDGGTAALKSNLNGQFVELPLPHLVSVNHYDVRSTSK